MANGAIAIDAHAELNFLEQPIVVIDELADLRGIGSVADDAERVRM
jgi:hypothetical protein